MTKYIGANCEQEACFEGQVKDTTTTATGVCKECSPESTPNDRQDQCLFDSKRCPPQCTCTVRDGDIYATAIDVQCPSDSLTDVSGFEFPKQTKTLRITTAANPSGNANNFKFAEYLNSGGKDSNFKFSEYLNSSGIVVVVDAVALHAPTLPSSTTPRDEGASGAAQANTGASLETAALCGASIPRNGEWSVTSAIGTSQHLHAMSLCPDASLLTDPAIKIAVCRSPESCVSAAAPTSKPGFNKYAELLCPAGAYARPDGSSNDGSGCEPCDKGGFYLDEDHRGAVGWHSHCACQLCKNGTYSKDRGAASSTDRVRAL